MIVRSMDVNDLDEIVKIEETLYKVPWNLKQYRYELEENEFAYLFVLENEGTIIGYYGFWVMFENVDITKVSVRKEFQGMKLSNILMEDCFKRVEAFNCENINLEVRVSDILGKVIIISIACLLCFVSGYLTRKVWLNNMPR